MSAVSPVSPVPNPFSPGGNTVQLATFPVQSPLFRAAVSTTRAVTPPPETQPTGTKTPVGTVNSSRYFDYGTSDIVRLLDQINPNGVNYEDLRTYPTDGLDAKDAEILNFLVQDTTFFNKFARLDQNPDTLSTQDIIIASQLAGDSLALTSDDLHYLGSASPGTTTPVGQSLPTSADNTAGYTPSYAPAAGVQNPQALENTLNQVLQKIGEDTRSSNPDLNPNLQQNNTPSGVSLSTVQAYTPPEGRFNQDETQAYNFLRSQQAQQIMAVMGNPHALVNTEAVRAMVAMTWNPSVYLRSPVIFLPPPEAPEEIDPVSAILSVQKPVRTLDFDKTQQFIDPSVGFVESIQMSGSKLSAILQKIDDSGVVSLKAIRDYVPQSDEDRAILQCLTQHNIFESLANMDHHGETLSLEDINIAVSHHMVVLSDAHLALFFHP